MKKLKGFDVPDNCSLIPDYILMGVDRRTNMNDQITLPYRSYLQEKLNYVKREYNKDVNKNWLDRTMEDVARFNHRSKIIDTIETQLKSIKEQDLIEIQNQ